MGASLTQQSRRIFEIARNAVSVIRHAPGSMGTGGAARACWRCASALSTLDVALCNEKKKQITMFCRLCISRKNTLYFSLNILFLFLFTYAVSLSSHFIVVRHAAAISVWVWLHSIVPSTSLTHCLGSALRTLAWALYTIGLKHACIVVPNFTVATWSSEHVSVQAFTSQTVEACLLTGRAFVATS